MKKSLVILTVIAGFFFASCGSQPAKDEEPAKQSETPAAEQAQPAQPEKAEAKAPDFGEKGNAFYKHCADEFAAVKAIIADIKANPAERKPIEKLQLFNNFEIKIEDAWGKIEIYQMNHPDKGMRDAAMAAESELMAILSEINLDADLYKVMAAIPADDPKTNTSSKMSLTISNVRVLTKTRKHVKRSKKSMLNSLQSLSSSMQTSQATERASKSLLKDSKGFPRTLSTVMRKTKTA